MPLEECEVNVPVEAVRGTGRGSESLFERCSWFYALCREYLFRDHTREINETLWPKRGPVPQSRVLEVGCGPGFYSCTFAEQYPQIKMTGIDLSESLLRRARGRAQARRLRNCNFVRGNALDLARMIDPVDAVIVSRLFLIMSDRREAMQQIFAVLRPGGRCFIAEPTSEFRTRIPLTCMWVLARLSSKPLATYREPRQAEILGRPEFRSLVASQPWEHVRYWHDGWYQYAVCERT